MIKKILTGMIFWICAALPVQAEDVTLPVENLHYDLHLSLNPDNQSLSVKAEISFTGKGLISFGLGSQMVLMEAFLDGRKTGVMARENEFFLPLSDSPSDHQLTLIYTGYFKNLETYRQQPRKYRGFLDPQGSFLPAGAGWYPQFKTKDFTYKLSVKTPSLHKAIAPGKLLEESTERGIYHAIFKVEHPIDEISLFAGPYQVKEKMVEGIRVRTYFHSTLNGLENDYLETTANYLKRYSQEIAAYPYSAFHIVSSPLPVGYGFPYLTYMGANVLRLPFIKYTSLGHEVLHSWWGNGVWVDYAAGNWAEGLTTYMADYASAEDQGAEQAKEKRLNWLRDYAALPKERDRPVLSFTSKTHTASQVIGYNKVAFIFHMLRQEIGKDAFKRGVQRFWQSHKFSQAGWSELQAAFQVEAKQNLSFFFKQWLEKPGAPELSLGNISTTPIHSGFETSVEILQKNATDKLSIPLTIGKQKFTTPLSGAVTRVSFKTSQRPNFVTLDPDFNVFRKLAEGETPPILRDVTLSNQAKLVVLGQDVKFKATAQQLAEQIMDTRIDAQSQTADILHDKDYLVIGTPKDIKTYLAQRPSLHPPAGLPLEGTAKAWVIHHKNKATIAFIEAKNQEALKALLRPLPHYGRRSYVVFNGAKVTAKGVWKTSSNPLRQRIP